MQNFQYEVRQFTGMNKGDGIAQKVTSYEKTLGRVVGDLSTLDTRVSTWIQQDKDVYEEKGAEKARPKGFVGLMQGLAGLFGAEGGLVPSYGAGGMLGHTPTGPILYEGGEYVMLSLIHI